MAAPGSRVPAAWPTPDDYVCYGLPSDADPAIIALALRYASLVLYKASGRQFGTWTETVRPASRSRCGISYGERLLLNQQTGWSWPSTWRLWCGSCGRSCRCESAKRIKLWRHPITAVGEVKINGEVLPDDEYRVDGWQWLVRTDPVDPDLGWPTSQDLDADADAEDTFSVTYTWGNPPDVDGQVAVAVYACEIAKMLLDVDCEMPSRVTSITKNGTTYNLLDLDDFLENGKTGLYLVDAWLKSVNPTGQSRPSIVVRPDARVRPVLRRGT